MHIHVIDHPLIQHKLTIMRKKETSSGEFRRLLQEITLLMGYELTRDLPLEDVTIETPLEKATGKQVAGKKLGIVPILRAGFGMVEGLTELMPSARIGVIGLYRDPVTAKPSNTTASSRMWKTATSSLSIRCSLPEAAPSQPST